jgi:2Fe-2S ferredoxin
MKRLKSRIYKQRIFMPTVHFIDAKGFRTSLQASVGESLMLAATNNYVKGIDGDCGGQCACGTCHVYVADDWTGRLSAIEARENDMLAFTNERRETSRLACQIVMSDALDGIEVHLPEGQH